MINITEEMHLEDEWFQQANKQTIDTLPQFINHLMNDYSHDYGTICHAITAAAIAAAYAADATPQGGITGFQASFIMWDFIRHWMYKSNMCGLKLINYDKMLYPQYEYQFDKTINQGTWTQIQEEAAKLLAKNKNAVPEVVAHWQSIVDGKLPFGFTIKED